MLSPKSPLSWWVFVRVALFIFYNFIRRSSTLLNFIILMILDNNNNKARAWFTAILGKVKHSKKNMEPTFFRCLLQTRIFSPPPIYTSNRALCGTFSWQKTLELRLYIMWDSRKTLSLNTIRIRQSTEFFNQWMRERKKQWGFHAHWLHTLN